MHQPPLRRAARHRAPTLLALSLGALLLSACADEDPDAVTLPGDAPGSAAPERPMADGGTRKPDDPVTAPAGTPGTVPGTGPGPDANGGAGTGASRRPVERDYAVWSGTGDLPPLPSPPLTPAPDASNEPVAETRPVSALRDLAIVADPRGRVIDPDEPTLTDADFEAGLPAPTTRVLPGTVVAGNTVPVFAGLSNREVFAGDVLEIVLDPDDPDGGHPGMFPEGLPEGARYIDNLDGTRSLIWRPLQPDVGIHSFTIVAVDASEPGLRSAQPVLIRVTLPDDPSRIENLAPGINAVPPSVARAGDPVVLALRVTDPNGTVPELVLPQLPPGATLIPEGNDPGTSILRFVPGAPGPLPLRLIARDADDPALVTESVVDLDILPASAFELPGARLRTLARPHDLLVGFAAIKGFYGFPDGAIYADLAGEEFDIVSSENSLKPDGLNPLPGVWHWAAADNLVAWAQSEGLAVHGHTLVWYTQLPGWMKRTPVAMREGHMREFIDRVMRRYASDILVWDVVNESFEDDGRYRESIWHEAMGERYIDIAFRQARSSDPDALLIYNDYDVAIAGPKADAMFDMLAGLRERDVPIDGVGFQVHLFADFDAFDELAASLARADALGLDAWITELDVSMRGNQTEAQQARVYAGVTSACLQAPNCRGLQTWGFTDRYSWRGQHAPLPLDARYQAKPAYRALQGTLGTR